MFSMPVNLGPLPLRADGQVRPDATLLEAEGAGSTVREHRHRSVGQHSAGSDSGGTQILWDKVPGHLASKLAQKSSVIIHGSIVGRLRKCGAGNEAQNEKRNRL